jgi:hypothetical protein
LPITKAIFLALTSVNSYKGLGDMFLPEDEATINHIQTKILDKAHQNFITIVNI